MSRFSTPQFDSEKGVDLFNYADEDNKSLDVPITAQLKIQGKFRK